jgi:hypothetical protein
MLQSTPLKEISSSKFRILSFHFRVDRCYSHSAFILRLFSGQSYSIPWNRIFLSLGVAAFNPPRNHTYNGSQAAHSDSNTYCHPLDYALITLPHNLWAGSYTFYYSCRYYSNLTGLGDRYLVWLTLRVSLKDKSLIIPIGNFKISFPIVVLRYEHYYAWRVNCTPAPRVV